jgi:ABC-type polysaccharide/polyol phosphate export permease
VELTLRARSRAELDAALRDLPKRWEELPSIAQLIPRKLQRGVRKTKLFFVFARVWSRLTLGLLLACGIALIAGAPVAAVSGGFLIVWALAGLAVWHFWRRAVSRGA